MAHFVTLGGRIVTSVQNHLFYAEMKEQNIDIRKTLQEQLRELVQPATNSQTYQISGRNIKRQYFNLYHHGRHAEDSELPSTTK